MLTSATHKALKTGSVHLSPTTCDWIQDRSNKVYVYATPNASQPLEEAVQGDLYKVLALNDAGMVLDWLKHYSLPSLSNGEAHQILGKLKLKAWGTHTLPEVEQVEINGQTRQRLTLTA